MTNEALKILGSYAAEEKKYEFSIERSDNISSQQISYICEEMIVKNMSYLTLDFENGYFIYFHNFGDKIRFVEGEKSEYAALQQLVKEDLEGTIFRSKDEENSEPPPEEENSIESFDNFEIGNESALIHNSLFQPVDHFKKTYSEAELYFQPFEAPGGDFYWTKDYQYKSLSVVGDCTGHGMQGAMIAMSAMTLLKQFFRLPPTSIEESVYEFYESFKSLMEVDQKGHFDLELGIVLHDKRTNEISYMGSGVDLLVKSAEGVQLYSTRKKQLITNKQTAYQLSMKPGDQLLMYTDGITDQFDADDRKKLRSKNLISIIESIPSQVGRNNFLEKFNEFRGTTKAMDDQTMLILTI